MRRKHNHCKNILNNKKIKRNNNNNNNNNKKQQKIIPSPRKPGKNHRFQGKSGKTLQIPTKLVTFLGFSKTLSIGCFAINI